MTGLEMINSDKCKTLDTQLINNMRNTLYLDLYDDKFFIISKDETVLKVLGDRKKALDLFYGYVKVTK